MELVNGTDGQPTCKLYLEDKYSNTNCQDTVTNLLNKNCGKVAITSNVKPEIYKTEDKDIPFILNNDLELKVVHEDKDGNKKTYKIDIERGYSWDGASIPSWLQWLIGKNDKPEYAVASMAHDVMCEDHSLVNNDRQLSSNIFKSLLKKNGTTSFCAKAMSWFVDAYQYCFSDWNDKKDKEIVA